MLPTILISFFIMNTCITEVHFNALESSTAVDKCHLIKRFPVFIIVIFNFCRLDE